MADGSDGLLGGGPVVEFGAVTAPSGLLVVGMAGWMDCWSEGGEPLSRRAEAVVPGFGGAHFSQWQGEAVVVAAARDRPLPVRASTAPSPFDGELAIAVLEVDLGLAWPNSGSSAPLLIGDLPVDRCGMVVGDAVALDSFVGLGADSIDGLADVTYWGKYADAVHADLGGEILGSQGHSYSWLDVSVEAAVALERAMTSWMDSHGLTSGLMVNVEEHTDFSRLCRAGWSRPLQAGVIDLAGCRVLGVAWSQGDHSMRHNGERRGGKVYPVTIERRDEGEGEGEGDSAGGSGSGSGSGGGSVLRWTIPPYQADVGTGT